MGTKNNPGPYDCYAKAEPDKPIFTLRAKDVSAPYLVEIWVAARQGHWDYALGVIEQMKQDKRVLAIIGDCKKFDEAELVADAMVAWRKTRDVEDRYKKEQA